MTEEAGAVQATEPAAAPEAPADAPQPSSSPREALDRAFQGVFGEEADDAREQPQEGPARGPDGKFAPKVTGDAPQSVEPKPQPEASDAPQRFSPDAKAAWATTPTAVKAEIGRAFRELEGGIERYRADLEPIRQYKDMAERSGTTLPEALAAYTGMEQLLRQDPIRGLEQLCSSLGTSLKDVAAHVMGQKPPERDQVIDGLRQEIAALQSQVGGVQQTFQQQRTHQVTQTVQQFAQSNPRFDELSGEISRLLQTGYVDPNGPDALQKAYDLAARINPAPQPAPPPAAQTGKARLSVQGAPSSGSNPASRQRSATPGEALSRSFSALGIS